MSLERCARTDSCKTSWKWTKGRRGDEEESGKEQSWGRWAAPPHCPCRKTTFSMLSAHSWEAAPGPSRRIPLGPLCRGCCKRSKKCHCWRDTPVLQGDSVLELQPHHQGPLFFPAEGWKYFWQSSNSERSLFSAAPRWQFPPRDQHKQGGYGHSAA